MTLEQLNEARVKVHVETLENLYDSLEDLQREINYNHSMTSGIKSEIENVYNKVKVVKDLIEVKEDYICRLEKENADLKTMLDVKDGYIGKLKKDILRLKSS